MLRFLVKSFVLAVLFLVLIQGFDKFFRDKNLVSYSMDKYTAEDQNVDIAIFGSSHAYNAYDPRIFENNLNLHTYNFSAPAQRFISAIPIMQQIINDNRIQLAVVDIFNMSIDPKISNENSKGLQYATFDNTNLSFKKCKYFIEIFGIDNALNIFPTIRNHSNWEGVFDLFHLDADIDSYNGFITQRHFISKNSWKEFKKKLASNGSKKHNKLSNGEKEVIDRVISVFNQKNIPFVFVSAPSYYYKLDSSYLSYQKLIKSYLAQKKVKFIDYNELWKELGLSNDDFKNPHHLNLKGSILVSQHLSNFIKTNFQLKESKNTEYLHNRYYLIDHNFKGAIRSQLVDNKALSEKLGFDKVILFEVTKNRFELLFEQNKSKNIHFKLSYHIDENERYMLSDEMKTHLRNNTIVNYELLKGESSIEYHGKLYKIYQFNYYGKHINNLRLVAGPKRNQKVFKIKLVNND